jgi:hypothetical protein
MGMAPPQAQGLSGKRKVTPNIWYGRRRPEMAMPCGSQDFRRPLKFFFDPGAGPVPVRRVMADGKGRPAPGQKGDFNEKRNSALAV